MNLMALMLTLLAWEGHGQIQAQHAQGHLSCCALTSGYMNTRVASFLCGAWQLHQLQQSKYS